ncbi:hypothetical protein HD806DRAFT_513138 [Xylariaceae sp. AK1471]|nr:hypothetical protein HD806DRAFT_513138 [Xylariaceae sp. AK1471]
MEETPDHPVEAVNNTTSFNPNSSPSCAIIDGAAGPSGPAYLTQRPETPEYRPSEPVSVSGDLPELPTENLQHGPPVPSTKLSIYDSLGRINACVVIGGTIVSLTVLGFLIFLWTGRGKDPGSPHASDSWRSIMLSGRLPQLITLSSVILRVSISMQTSICGSFVAALVLERQSIPLSQSAPLSVFRSVNAGSCTLVWQILRKKPWNRLLFPEVNLILVLVVGNIAAQLSSTILLSDLHDYSLVGFANETQRNLSITSSGGGPTGRWSLPPKDISLFGEIYSGYTATPNSFGLSDTGVKRHSMLPFTEDRTAIRSYQGPSLVMSSRVACMPPVISGNIWNSIVSEGTRRFGNIAGQILIKETLSRAGLSSQGQCNSSQCLYDIPFQCAIPSNYGNVDPIATAFCTATKWPEKLLTSDWKLDVDPWESANSTPVLVFSTNMNDSGWKPLDNLTVNLPQPVIKDEWISYDFSSGYMVNLTFCFNARNVMLSNVSMGTTRGLMEPTLGHQIATSDSAAIRKFLGADPLVQDLNERGVLIIQDIRDRNDHAFGALDSLDIPSFQWGAQRLEFDILQASPNQTLAGCEVCEGDFSGPATEYSRTFLDIVQTTRRASVALQTVYTILAQSSHDQILDSLTIPMSVDVVQTTPTTIPTRSLGLIVVLVLTTVNITCILALTALFLFHSRYSMIGNFWYAISQIVSDITSDVLLHGNMAKDPDVSKRLNNDDPLVRLMMVPETGDVKIVEAGLRPASNAPCLDSDSKKADKSMNTIWLKMKNWQIKILRENKPRTSNAAIQEA